MSKNYPGPYANLSNPTGDDAIYAAQHITGPHAGTGSLNVVNPSGRGQPNNDAINAAAVQGGDPSTWTTSPNYVPATSLVNACNGYEAWQAQQGPKTGDTGKTPPPGHHPGKA